MTSSVPIIPKPSYRYASLTANLAQAAGTYDLGTVAGATGTGALEVIIPFMPSVPAATIA